MTWPGDGIVDAFTCMLVIRRVSTAEGPGTVKDIPVKTTELAPFSAPQNTFTFETWDAGGGLSISSSGCVPAATLEFSVTCTSVTAEIPAVPPVQLSTISPTWSAGPLTGMFNGVGADALQLRGAPEETEENFARKASKPPCPEV